MSGLPHKSEDVDSVHEVGSDAGSVAGVDWNGTGWPIMRSVNTNAVGSMHGGHVLT